MIMKPKDLMTIWSVDLTIWEENQKTRERGQSRKHTLICVSEMDLNMVLKSYDSK